MERVFTKKIGRFEVGQVFDWPYQTWDGVAKSAKTVLDSFSRPTEAVVANAVRGAKR